jgi:5-methylcytosine-specific restriction enzyme B
MPLSEYLAQRYADYVTRLPAEEWLSDYRDLCDRTAEIGRRLNEHHANENSLNALSAAFAALNRDLDDYLREIWYARYNGVASIRLGGINEETFNNLKQNTDFWPLFAGALRLAGGTPNEQAITVAYDAMVGWMEEFAQIHKVNRFSAFVNRFFAACLPDRVTSIGASGKLTELLTALAAWDEYVRYRGDSPETWLRQNRFLLTTLHEGLGGQQWVEKIPHNTPHQRSIFFWWLLENMVADDAGQIILFGSPGTGKTYTAKKYAKHGVDAWLRLHSESEWERVCPTLIEKNVDVVQFHPSFTYEDFIEGIRPSAVTEGRLELALVPGVFKRFCKEAAKWEIDFWTRTGRPLTDKTTIDEVYLDREPTLWSFLSGQPSNDRVIDHLPPYYFIIDEINRAELSRVLGETMLVLEYRGTEHKVKTQYSSLVTMPNHAAAFLYDRGTNYFFVPFNLRIIGTMNVIDRSVEAFDFALRRRFRWHELKFDAGAMREILSSVSGSEISLAVESFEGLNARIANFPSLGSDYQIGHAYAKRLTEYSGPGDMRSALRFVWRNHLEPLLREYLRGLGRPERVEEVIKGLKGNFPS